MAANTPLTIAATVLGLFGTGVGIWSQIDTGQINRRVQDVEGKLAISGDARATSIADRDYLLKVTEKVYSAALAKESSQQIVTVALTVTLPDTYYAYRCGLLRALDRNGADSGVSFEVQNAYDYLLKTSGPSKACAPKSLPIQTPAKDTTATASTPAPTSPPATAVVGATASTTTVSDGGGRGPAIDVFWCDGGSAAPDRQALAARLVEALDRTNAYTRIRLRPLPTTTNALAGYRITDDQIRYELAESKFATGVLATGKQVVPSLRLARIGYPTPNYMSVFICSGTTLT